MLRLKLKRRLGLALAFALAEALMLPMTAFRQEDNQPRSRSESHMSVYCSTTITGADGKVTESSCTEETSSTDSSSMTFADPPSPPDFSADLNAMELELESVMNELMAGLFDES